MSPRPPELRPYRIAIYVAYGVIVGFLGVLLIRSVVGDLFGRARPGAPKVTAAACLDEMERLFGALAARAVHPAPGGLDSDALAREWDRWSRRWEDDVARVSARCHLDAPADPATAHLATALDGLENLRRALTSSSDEASREARRIREALGAARRSLGLR